MAGITPDETAFVNSVDKRTRSAILLPMVHDVDGARFAWREAGDGPLVVLLHGLGGSRTSWEPQLTGLGVRWRVAAWDMPGYGAAAPLEAERVTFRRLADAAADWIAALGESAAHVVGISVGGMVAQYMAAFHPARVRSLTLLATSPRFGMDGTRPDEWRAARLSSLDQGLEPVDFAERVLRSLAGPHISDDAFEGQRAAMARVTGAALRRSIDCLVTHDTTQLLAGIHQPALVAVGALDGETPPAYSEYLATHLPNAHLRVVEGAGHLLNVEAPEHVNALIAEHLTALETA